MLYLFLYLCDWFTVLFYNSCSILLISGHWVVVAIDMVTRKIYHLDPLPDGRPDEELKRMVNE